MRNGRFRVVAAVLAIAVAGCGPGKPARPMTFGVWISEWHPDWDLLKAAPELYTSLSFSWGGVHRDGSFSRVAPKNRDEIIRWARGNGIKTYLTFGGGKPDLPAGISGKAGDRCIRELKAEVEQYGFDGVDVDIEELDGSARVPYTRFIEKLAAALKAMKTPRTLSVTLQEVQNEKDEAGTFMDYAALGKVADTVRVMCYDINFDSPGPIMSREAFDGDLAFARSKVPAGKLVPAVPWYGRDWNVTDKAHQDILDRMTEKADGIAGFEELVRVTGAKPVWREPEGELTFSYTRAGKYHEVWMADPRQFAWMVDAAAKAGVAGVYAWQVEYGTPEYLKVVRAKFPRPRSGGGEPQ